jgi:hypothetical protein
VITADATAGLRAAQMAEGLGLPPAGPRGERLLPLQSTIGAGLRARSEGGRDVEASLACRVLNRMTELGRPSRVRSVGDEAAPWENCESGVEPCTNAAAGRHRDDRHTHEGSSRRGVEFHVPARHCHRADRHQRGREPATCNQSVTSPGLGELRDRCRAMHQRPGAMVI